jgi:chromosome segregation ATPase
LETAQLEKALFLAKIESLNQDLDKRDKELFALDEKLEKSSKTEMDLLQEIVLLQRQLLQEKKNQIFLPAEQKVASLDSPAIQCSGDSSKLIELEKRLAEEERKNRELEETLDTVKSQLEKSTHELKEKKTAADEFESEVHNLKNENEKLKTTIDLLHRKLEKLDGGKEAKRMEAHEEKVSKKGNIRLALRVRPLDQHELQDDKLVLKEKQVLLRTNKESKAFDFDIIWDRTSDQKQVYREVRDLVISSLDGKDVTIMALDLLQLESPTRSNL